ncbi:MAG TPA: carboxypeptidase-like regulatory domain-containing protein [Rubricoccaceae bacterium]|nr:carboxypeptidase-like regulatory domain-containing protein [Rubricoccaceae bacterium]
MALALSGCLGNPERGNPLDPLSENFEDEGGATGFVSRFYPPFQGIPGAEVRLIPLDETRPILVTRTDATGRFVFRDVPTGTYRAEASASGFAGAADTLGVTLDQAGEEVVLRLDGIPFVEAHTVRTEHINRFFPEPFSRLTIDVTANDPDGVGDVVRVSLQIPDFGFIDTLRAVTGAPGRYNRTFLEGDLPAPLQALLGRSLRLVVRDLAGVNGVQEGVQIVRIIEGFAQDLNPRALAEVGPTPTLTWVPPLLPFAFTQRVDIALPDPDTGQQVLVRQFPGLPRTAAAVTVAPPLDPGEYVWTVWVLDDFGNASRSFEAGFRVVPPRPS